MSHSLSKKNVGILTLPLSHNYGGILQCIALQEIVGQLGHETLLLDRRTKISPVKKMLKNLLFGRAFNQIEAFKKNHIRRKSQPIYSTEILNDVVRQNNLNAIIVGSDQVWRERFVFGAFLDYFLHFLTDASIIKLSYAASFGSATITPSRHTAEISEALNSFTAISVREDTAITILHEAFAIEGVKQALDPTLLLPRTFYENLAKQQIAPSFSKKYVLTYLLDKKPGILTHVNAAAASLNLSIKEIDGQLTGYLNRLFTKKVSVENWLMHFQHATFVITDSYHGMLFSIIFEKQFIVLVNEKRGAARFESLARQFGLENRLYYNDNIPLINTLPKINYTKLANTLEVLKKASISFLHTNLSTNL